MLLFGRQDWVRWHRKWFLFCLVVVLTAGAWYTVVALRAESLPGGSSGPGLASGAVAGLLFLYLFAFALRKLPPFRLWFARRPTKFRLAEHIWLGLLTFPLVSLHSGLLTRWGGLLTTLLLVVYFIVWGSGLWGLLLQQALPRRLLTEVPDEVIFSQIPALSEQLRCEAELLVLATCGPSAEDSTGALSILERNQHVLRAVRAGKGSGLLHNIPSVPLPDTEPLRHYFLTTIDPYLRPDDSRHSPIRLLARREADFRDLRARISPAARPVVDALEDLCERRRQFEEQARLHSRLHRWITFHTAVSAALLVLLVWHAVLAFRYW